MQIVPPVPLLVLYALVSSSGPVGAQSREDPAMLERRLDEARDAVWIDLDAELVEPLDVLPTVLAGRVTTPEGSPVSGAVIVSSAGGQAVSGADGSFRLEVELPSNSIRVQVTAVRGAGTTGVVGSVSVAVAPGTANPIGEVTLASSGGCQPGWLPTFGMAPGANGSVHALAVFDDGGGPALYAGGEFDAVGNALASLIAKWDGTSWSPLGGGLSSGPLGSETPAVFAMTVFDDGGGPALYVGGDFDHAGSSAASCIARWNGTTWSSVPSGFVQGLGPIVRALTVFDDGGGPALYAGGDFTSTGSGASVNHVAKWDGTSWSALGSGTNGSVRTLLVHDDGGGPALYAGGDFTTAGGSTRNRIARWDGSSWSALGSGMNGGVHALAVFDDGGGPALHAGGLFTNAGGVTSNRIAKWNGAVWSPLGSGTNDSVLGLAAHDDGGGMALYAVGAFTTAGGLTVNRTAKWNGASWSALGSGMNAQVAALAFFDDGSGGGPVLYTGGTFTRASGAVAERIAKWNEGTWEPLGKGLNGTVTAIAAFDDGSGPALHVGGDFTGAGGTTMSGIARWDGASWQALGAGMSPASHVWAMTVFDDGGGPALYAGGRFSTAGGVAVSNIARWNGTSWSALAGGGTGSSIFALTVFDDGGGPALYAAGFFTSAGGALANRIARWNGTGWSPLGSGLDGSASALAVFDDGGGAALYAGGDFTNAGGAAASHVARWNGAAWSGVGSGTNASVPALVAFDDGGGPALYAGGLFTSAGGAAANRVAKWDGATWSPLGSGMNSSVFGLTVFDDGSGPALHAGGSFTSAGGAAASRIARWDGSSWSPLGNGTSGTVFTLAVLDEGEGDGPALHAGGSFPTAFDSGDGYVARWQGCLDTNAPVLACPDFVLRMDKLGTPPGEIVSFSVSASDNRDPSPSLVCVPPSGSFFPRGTTLVTCTATDAAGNQSVCTFPVRVEPKFQRR